MDSSQEDEYYPIVHLFPTGEGRFDIKKITSTGDHLIPCNSINHKYLDDEKAFISDCPEVVTYIKNIFTEHLTENETYRCKYLNYSINSVVKNNENQKYKEKTLIEAYSRLATNLSVCKDSIKTIEDSVFYNVKELSDIYYKFKNHIKIINDYETTDCQDLYHIVKSYLNIKSTCRDEKNKFCDAVDKFKIDCLSKIKKIKCKHVEYNLKPFPTWDVNTIVEFEEAEAEAQPQERQDRANVVEDVKEGGVDTEETARSSHIGIPDVDHNGDSLKDNASNPVRTITYTSLGLILPLATLYRFTPLGSWVSTKILGRNKLMENMNKNHYELLLNDVRNGEMSLNNTTYSISYNSAAK